MEPAFNSAKVLALIMEAMSVSFHLECAILRACKLSWTSDLGCLFKMREGRRAARIADENNLDSVAGTLDSGRV